VAGVNAQVAGPLNLIDLPRILHRRRFLGRADFVVSGNLLLASWKIRCAACELLRRIETSQFRHIGNGKLRD